jgi:hypothetical protein
VTSVTIAGPSTRCDTGTDERQEEVVHIDLGGCPLILCGKIFPASRETFCNVYCPQFDTTKLDVVSALENIFDIPLVQLILEQNQQVRSAGFGSGKMLPVLH